MKTIISSIALIATLIFPLNANALDNKKENINQLTVIGYGQTKILGEIAKINVSILIKDKNLKTVGDTITQKSKKLIEALKNNKAEKISVDQLIITPNYSKEEPSVLLDHTGIMNISFETNYKEAGKLTTIAMNNGANKLDDVTLKPSEEKINKAKEIALQLASKNALNKANIALKSLNLKQRAITAVNIHPEPYLAQNRPMYVTANLQSQNVAKNIGPEMFSKEHDIKATLTLKILYQDLGKTPKK